MRGIQLVCKFTSCSLRACCQGVHVACRASLVDCALPWPCAHETHGSACFLPGFQAKTCWACMPCMLHAHTRPGAGCHAEPCAHPALAAAVQARHERLHLSQREGSAQREVLVVVHVLRVAHKRLQRNARAGVAVHDAPVLGHAPVAVPTRASHQYLKRSKEAPPLVLCIHRAWDPMLCMKQAQTPRSPPKPARPRTAAPVLGGQVYDADMIHHITGMQLRTCCSSGPAPSRPAARGARSGASAAP